MVGGTCFRCRRRGIHGWASLRIGVARKRCWHKEAEWRSKVRLQGLLRARSMAVTRSARMPNRSRLTAANESGDLYSLWDDKEEPNSKMPLMWIPAAERRGQGEIPDPLSQLRDQWRVPR